jgi:hypothetical protein
MLRPPLPPGEGRGDPTNVDVRWCDEITAVFRHERPVRSERVVTLLECREANACFGGGRVQVPMHLNRPGFDGGSPLAREERMGHEVQI